MKYLLFVFIVLLTATNAHAQFNLAITVKSAETGEVVGGATVNIKSQALQGVTNDNGYLQLTVTLPGNYDLEVSHTDYETQNIAVQVRAGETVVEIKLNPAEEEMEEIIIQSTRTSRTIDYTATRVETIDGEEIDEKSNMRPANVSMLLHESTGLQVQQTSATSANASIRMQGLDGRYTQLLKDGYPNYGQFAGGLSILEIPPLDLEQVEIIKGPASTLYGGGAIAGVINFISKKPGVEPERRLLINQSNIGQTNIGGYASQRRKRFGFSVLALYNYQKNFDVDDDDFSELPLATSISIHPRLYFYPNERFTVSVGNSYTASNNKGGDMKVIDGKPDSVHRYFEKNETLRNTTTLELKYVIDSNRTVDFKQSVSVFNRDINLPDYLFSGKNSNSFSELSFRSVRGKHTINTGLNIIYDRFRQSAISNDLRLNSTTTTVGAYGQHTWDVNDKLIIESGLRIDKVKYQFIGFDDDEWFLLPRISMFYKFNPSFTARLTGGLGYKTPTSFTEQTETMQYRNIQPLQNVNAEKSNGFTSDFNFRTKIGRNTRFSINQLFFVTSINNPLVLQPSSTGLNYVILNRSKPVQTMGFETNVKWIYREHFKCFLGYTYIDAQAKYLARDRFLTLVPRHKINTAILYEKEKNIKLGIEGYFTGGQYLSSGFRTPSFWEFGFFAEKTIKFVSFYINFENFTDQRQSNYKRVVNAPNNRPTFDEIWNHTEGFVVNGGVKFNW